MSGCSHKRHCRAKGLGLDSQGRTMSYRGFAIRNISVAVTIGLPPIKWTLNITGELWVRRGPGLLCKKWGDIDSIKTDFTR